MSSKSLVGQKVYVAVGKVVQDSKSVLMWALHNHSAADDICLILVHQPPSLSNGGCSGIQDEEIERGGAHKILDHYICICNSMGFKAHKLLIENDSVVKGILDTISNCGIRQLVMGAASDKSYSRNMMQIKSRKALSVHCQASVACRIYFVCTGRLIHVREGIADMSNYIESYGQPLSLSHLHEQKPTTLSKSQSAVHRQSSNFLDLVHGYFYRGRSVSASTTASIDDYFRVPSTPEEVSNEFNDHESSPHSNILSQCSSGRITTSSSSVSNNGVFRLQGSQMSMELLNSHDEPLADHPKRAKGNQPIPKRESLDEALRQATADKEAFEEFISLKRDALDEAFRRAKAEQVAAEAIERAKGLENLVSEEQKLRKEREEALDKGKGELGKALEEKLLLQDQIAETAHKVKDLEQEIISVVEVLKKCKKERDETQIERDNEVKEAEELKKSISEQASSSTSTEAATLLFTKSDIEQATNNYHESVKIGEGGFGNIYRAELQYTQVAIKLLTPNGLQGASEFNKEVEILSKVRHPNLVSLIGACPESCALIYEYLPNGSLEDRLECKDNSKPLSWPIRLRIAAEVCSVLIFLQSCKPDSIVHGDVKPSNILLDANFVSKLSDFGIARLLKYKEGSSANQTLIWRTDPKGTPPYIDPEFFYSGILTSKSDVYSFGVVLMRLLTGRSAIGLVAEVQCALSDGKLKEILDESAGEWPLPRAEELAKLAVRCCEKHRRRRPDLAAEVWEVLKYFCFFGRQRVMKLLQSK